MKATAHIDVLEFGGRLYPVGSDHPLPETAITTVTYSRNALHVGDIVIDKFGEPWSIDVVNDNEGDWMGARSAHHSSNVTFSTTALHGPLTVIYRQGSPVDFLVA